MANWNERGMATAEYATGMVGAVVMATVLYRIGNADWFFDELRAIIGHIVETLPFVGFERDWRWPWFM